MDTESIPTSPPLATAAPDTSDPAPALVPDLSTVGWPTKYEAAESLGVGIKTLEKYVAQKRLRQRMQSQINKPQRAVIDPLSIEEELQRRARREAEAKAVEAARQAAREAAANAQVSLSGMVSNLVEAKLSPQAADLETANPRAANLEAFLTSLFETLAPRDTTSWPIPLWLTTEQAIRYTGLSARFLDRMVSEGRLSRIEAGVRGYRYARISLDSLEVEL